MTSARPQAARSAPARWYNARQWLVPVLVVAFVALVLRTLEVELAQVRYHDIIRAFGEV